MKKIVILSERLPYPPTSGTKNLLYNYCKILHEKLAFEVVNISFLEADDDISQKPNFIKKTYPLPDPSNKAKLSNLLVKTVIQRKYPIQVSLFFDNKIKNQIYEILEFEKPDFIIADFVRTTEYLKDYSGHKIADLQDLLSLRYKRQLEVDLENINPYGAYLYRMPKFLQSILQVKFLKEIVLKNEVKLLERFEKDVGKHYDRIMFVAQNEGEIFDQMIGQKKSLIVPLGVDFGYFSRLINIEKEENSIAFLGALSVAHNESGIIHFIENIYPLIKAVIPNSKLYIIGGGATNRIKKFQSEDIIITGRVDDVRETVGKCTVFVCPLIFGSGIKTKNLEAMAMGMPSVVTSIGAENINAKNEEAWIIADSNEEFASSVIRILNDSKLQESMGQNAQEFIKNNFTWSIAEERFSNFFDIDKQ